MSKLSATQRNYLIERIDSLRYNLVQKKTNELFPHGNHTIYSLTPAQLYDGLMDGTVTFNNNSSFSFKSCCIISKENKDLIEQERKQEELTWVMTQIENEAQTLKDKVMFLDNMEVLDLLEEFTNKFS